MYTEEQILSINIQYIQHRVGEKKYTYKILVIES